MARTTVAGFGGVFDSNDATNDAAVLSWSATVNIDANKIDPPFGSKWRRTVLGAGDITGSLTANLEYDALVTAPFDISGSDWSAMTGTITLTADAGDTGNSNKLTFAGCLFNASMNYVNGQAASFTCDFANTGTDAALVWDETVGI